MADLSAVSDTRATRLEVLISGSTLSFLTFKLKNCQGDTEGFLYGHISNRVTQEVSDTQEGYESINKTITITDFICFKNKFTFYDKCGKLDGAKSSRVECLTTGTNAYYRTVGWFSFRRNTTSGMSVREKYVHQELMGIFTPLDDTLLHLLLVETVSSQFVLEQLSISVNTYAPSPSGRHIVSPHSLRILNLDITSSTKSYKYPVEIAGLSLSHSVSLDTILTPFSDQISTKLPFLQSSQMITQISNRVLERMGDMKTQILNNSRNIDQLKSDICQMSRGTAYSLDLTPSAPPSSLLNNINRKNNERDLPQKSVSDYNTYQAPSSQDKIINQDLPHYAHAATGLFPPLEQPPIQDQPPPYSPSTHGYTGVLEIPSHPPVPMDTSSHVAQPTFTHNSNHNSNNNNNNNNNNRIPIVYYDKYEDTAPKPRFYSKFSNNRGVKSAKIEDEESTA